MELAIRARIASAELFFEAFRKAYYVLRRKFCALKILEELTLATEDFAKVYFAQRDHGTTPVIQSLLSGGVDGKLEAR